MRRLTVILLFLCGLVGCASGQSKDAADDLEQAVERLPAVSEAEMDVRGDLVNGDITYATVEVSHRASTEEVTDMILQIMPLAEEHGVGRLESIEFTLAWFGIATDTQVEIDTSFGGPDRAEARRLARTLLAGSAP